MKLDTFQIRMPHWLNDELQEMARNEFRSKNSLIVSALNRFVEEQKLCQYQNSTKMASGNQSKTEGNLS